MPVWASISRSAARVHSHLHCICLDRTRAQWRFVAILTRIRFIPLESYLHSFRHLKLSMTDACYGNLSISEKRWSTLKRCEYLLFFDLFTVSTSEIYFWNDMQLITWYAVYFLFLWLWLWLWLWRRSSTYASAHVSMFSMNLTFLCTLMDTPMCFLKVRGSTTGCRLKWHHINISCVGNSVDIWFMIFMSWMMFETSEYHIFQATIFKLFVVRCFVMF